MWLREFKINNNNETDLGNPIMFTSINSILLWGQRLQLKNNLTNPICCIFFLTQTPWNGEMPSGCCQQSGQFFPHWSTAPIGCPAFNHHCGPLEFILITRKWEIGTLLYSWTETPVTKTLWWEGWGGCANGNGEPGEQEGWWFGDKVRAKDKDKGKALITGSE